MFNEGIHDVPHPFDRSPVTFLGQVHPREDNALAVRHADWNRREHERLILVQINEVHGDRSGVLRGRGSS